VPGPFDQGADGGQAHLAAAALPPEIVAPWMAPAESQEGPMDALSLDATCQDAASMETTRHECGYLWVPGFWVPSTDDTAGPGRWVPGFWARGQWAPGFWAPEP